MDVFTVTLILYILTILILVFIIHKQRETILRHKHIIAIDKEKIDLKDGQLVMKENIIEGFKDRLLAYQIKEFDEITSEYAQKIRTSPWKTFKVAAEQLNEYLSKVPEFYFQHKESQRNRVFNGWAQELRVSIENSRELNKLILIFEGFSEAPGSLDVKLMQRIREATPVFKLGTTPFDHWSRDEPTRAIMERELQKINMGGSLEKEREGIGKMLNLQCLEGFFDPSVKKNFTQVCARKSV